MQTISCHLEGDPLAIARVLAKWRQLAQGYAVGISTRGEGSARVHVTIANIPAHLAPSDFLTPINQEVDNEPSVTLAVETPPN